MLRPLATKRICYPGVMSWSRRQVAAALVIPLLAVAWLAALGLSIAWFTRRPRTVALIPVALALVWFATVVAGARYLAWS